MIRTLMGIEWIELNVSVRFVVIPWSLERAGESEEA